MTSPLRKLYQILCEHESEDLVQTNLLSLSDYAELTGSGAARFCEWAYHRLDKRTLLQGLMGTLLRHSDVKGIARTLGVSEKEIGVLTFDALLSRVLEKIGVREPRLPPPVHDGLAEIALCREWLDDRESSLPASLAGDSPTTRCRRGLERLLKVIATFHSAGECAAAFTRVVEGRLHGFKSNITSADELSKYIANAEIGGLSYLLQAVSVELDASGGAPAYMRGMPLWPKEAFDRINAVNEALKPFVHDKATGQANERDGELGRLAKALDRLERTTSEANAAIRVPVGVQFFRCLEDGHGRHYEGYLKDGTLLRCFECATIYELHQPYLFLAATNPSAVDMACVPLPDQFRRGV